jgi:hypothetical protein
MIDITPTANPTSTSVCIAPPYTGDLDLHVDRVAIPLWVGWYQ